MDLQTFQPKLIGLVVVTALLISSTHVTARIYQWTDSEGNVHFSDKVPPDQRDTADSVELSEPPPSQADVNAAKAVAERIREAADRTAEGNRSREEEVPAQPAKAPKPNVTRKLEIPPLPPLPENATPAERDARYEQAMERYRMAQDCFGPYKNRNGSTKPEAFDVCPVIPRPRESDY